MALSSNLAGTTLITALQISRVASIALQYLKKDDIIITSDADIWPLSKKFWRTYLTKLLDPANDDLFIYNGPFFRGQRQSKDCNFAALTSIAAKTRIWRDTFSIWVDSLQYAPRPRLLFCVYQKTKDNIPMPILPWYSEKERNVHFSKFISRRNTRSIDVHFADLLTTFLQEGPNFFGK